MEAIGEFKVYDSVPSSVQEFAERIKNAIVIVVGRYGVPAGAGLDVFEKEPLP